MILNHVLWASIFLALILGGYSKLVTNFTRGTNRVEELIHARAIAQSGLEVGLASISKRGSFRSLPASLYVPIGDGHATIKFENEAGKVDVNSAPIEMIELTAQLISAPVEQRQIWIKKIAQTKGSNQSFTSLEETVSWLNLQPNSFRRFRQLYTVHSNLHFVDTAKADPELARILNYASEPGWTAAANSDAIKIIVEGVTRDGTTVFNSAIYKARPLENPPYQLMSFQSR